MVQYASKEPSAFAQMLGGLIEANVLANPQKEKDFDVLIARVGIWVTDIDEGVTLVFESGRLMVYNGLEFSVAKRTNRLNLIEFELTPS